MKNRAPQILSTSIATLLLGGAAHAVDVTVENHQLIGHSAFEFSTTQGANGWENGYYNLTTDLDMTYATADFQQMPVEGGGYGLGPGDPPWTAISNAYEGHPNGTNNGEEHWAIRRYTIGPGEGGSTRVNWFVRDTGNGGDVSAAVFVNGTQVDSVPGPNTHPGSVRSIALTLAPGDKVDLALQPNGPDGADGSRFALNLFRQNQVTFTGLTQIADSMAEFSGTQGQAGWSHGYYDTTLNGQPDPGGTDFIPFPNNYFDGNGWNFPQPSDPPWTELYNPGAHPNGLNNAEDHWATRRYTVEAGEAGDLFVEWSLSKGNVNGGDGTTVRVLLNGVVRDAYGVEYYDSLGIRRGVVLPGVQVGDKIDVALTSEGTQSFFGFGGDPSHDGADGSLFAAKIYVVPEPGSLGLLLASAAWLLRRRRLS